MFSHKHYVPILKGKDGDFWALANIKPETAQHLTPLIEVVPPTAAMSEETRLATTARRIETSWPGRTAFVDLIWRDNAPILQAGDHVVERFFTEARAKNLKVIPVTGLTRSPSYQTAIGKVVRHDKQGLLLRLIPEQFDDLNILSIAIDSLLKLFDLDRSSVDLLLDFGSVYSTATGLLTQSILSAIGMIPHLAEWRNFIVGSGSFPPTVTVLPQGTWSTLPRREWTAWNAVISKPPARLPSYSDYAVGDPSVPFTGRASIPANMRYSTDANFYVWRGYVTHTHPLGHGQMNGICADLVARSEYSGDSFSRGDHEIQERATNQGSPGGPQQWRQWATNHYIELVASQIASLP